MSKMHFVTHVRHADDRHEIWQKKMPSTSLNHVVIRRMDLFIGLRSEPSNCGAWAKRPWMKLHGVASSAVRVGRTLDGHMRLAPRRNVQLHVPATEFYRFTWYNRPIRSTTSTDCLLTHEGLFSEKCVYICSVCDFVKKVGLCYSLKSWSYGGYFREVFLRQCFKDGLVLFCCMHHDCRYQKINNNKV